MQNGGWDGVTLLADLEAAIAEQAKPNQYEQAIDDELVNSFLGTKDDFKDAKSALLAIIDWNCKVALDPAVSAEAAKLLEQAKPQQEPVGYVDLLSLPAIRRHGLKAYLSFEKYDSDYSPLYTSPQAQEDAYGMCVNGCARQCDFCLKHYGKA